MKVDQDQGKTNAKKYGNICRTLATLKEKKRGNAIVLLHNSTASERDAGLPVEVVNVKLICKDGPERQTSPTGIVPVGMSRRIVEVESVLHSRSYAMALIGCRLPRLCFHNSPYPE